MSLILAHTAAKLPGQGRGYNPDAKSPQIKASQ
jgi:hypothetical protein